MTTHERFLLTELELRIREGERRGRVEQALAELRRQRPTFRQRFAGTLLALAYRLSPETMTPTERDRARRAPARGRL